MKIDYITINDNRYAVLCNMAAIEEFAELKGWKTINELANISEMSIADLNDLMYCSIVEGENREGRLFALTAKELKQETNINDLMEFMKVFKKQCALGEGDDKKKVMGMQH